MQLTEGYIIEAMRKQGFIAVHQILLLDWLNSWNAAVQGTQGLSALDRDPPAEEYGIEPELVESILEVRNSLGGFHQVRQLDKVSNMAEDDFDSLLGAFRKTFAFPTTKGLEFDNMIAAIAALELNVYRPSSEQRGIVSMMRQLLLPDHLPGNQRIMFPWDQLIPSSAKYSPPSGWAIQDNLMKAVSYIRSHPVVKIDGVLVNLSQVLAGLDARLDPEAREFSTGNLKVGEALPTATYLKTLGQSLFQYVEQENETFAFGAKGDRLPLGGVFAKVMRPEDAYGMADAHGMEYLQNRTLTWNLINYYVAPESPVKQRMAGFTEKLNLGNLEGSRFEGDDSEFRRGLAGMIHSSALAVGSFNGRGEKEKLPEWSRAESFTSFEEVAEQIGENFVGLLLNLRQMEGRQPAIVSWNRLEGRPRKNDVSQPWRAEVRDALWFLSRQWQLGEFAGEDTGSAIKMRVSIQRSEVDQYALRGGNGKPYGDTVPMEAVAERVFFQPDLALCQEMGLHWSRIVTERFLNGPNPQPGDLPAVLLDFSTNSAFHFTVPSAVTAPEVWANPELMNLYASISGGRALNGWAIYTGLLSNPASNLLSGYTLFPGGVLTELDEAGNEFRQWFETTYQRPANSADFAWDPSHLEYQFACSAPAAVGPGPDSTVLVADEYASGQLDWYNFDIEADEQAYTTLRPSNPNTALVRTDTLTLLPGDLRFPGMPLPRWWQMEDGNLNFEHMVLHTQDTASLPFLEFIASYSNDWLMLPFRVPTGSICEVKDLVVKDVFGQQTRVRAAGYGDNADWRRWSMYTLHRRHVSNTAAADTRVFFPPAVLKLLEGKPVEEVRFARDEMANMVWGIEQVIPDGMGAGEQGYEAGLRLYNYLVDQAAPPTPPVLVSNEAKLRYRLGTTVPENWIPFLPMRLGGLLSSRTQLQRAAMPRVIADEPMERVRPRTELLRTNFDGTIWHPYYIHEEEVPRSGAIVRQSWQRTRWYDGRVITWVGRRKLNGTGEGNSGLKFDILEEKKD